MGVIEFVCSVPQRDISDSVGELLVGLRRRSNWLSKRGVNVFDREWDVLIVLNACWVDLLDSVADEYSCLDGGRWVYSVGGTSPEWIKRTFGPASLSTLELTAYVTGNPNSS